MDQMPQDPQIATLFAVGAADVVLEVVDAYRAHAFSSSMGALGARAQNAPEFLPVDGFLGADDFFASEGLLLSDDFYPSLPLDPNAAAAAQVLEADTPLNMEFGCALVDADPILDSDIYSEADPISYPEEYQYPDTDIDSFDYYAQDEQQNEQDILDEVFDIDNKTVLPWLPSEADTQWSLNLCAHFAAETGARSEGVEVLQRCIVWADAVAQLMKYLALASAVRAPTNASSDRFKARFVESTEFIMSAAKIALGWFQLMYSQNEETLLSMVRHSSFFKAQSEYSKRPRNLMVQVALLAEYTTLKAGGVQRYDTYVIASAINIASTKSRQLAASEMWNACSFVVSLASRLSEVVYKVLVRDSTALRVDAVYEDHGTARSWEAMALLFDQNAVVPVDNDPEDVFALFLDKISNLRHSINHHKTARALTVQGSSFNYDPSNPLWAEWRDARFSERVCLNSVCDTFDAFTSMENREGSFVIIAMNLLRFGARLKRVKDTALFKCALAERPFRNYDQELAALLKTK